VKSDVSVKVLLGERERERERVGREND